MPTKLLSRGALRALTGERKIKRLFDQHAVVELGGDACEVGDVLGCSVESPYWPPFATWRTIPLVDDDYNVMEMLDVLY